MTYNFGLPRLGLFIGCLVLFFFLGGFTAPEIADDSMLQPAKVNRAWMSCVIMFVVGAGCVSLVDHYVGVMEPSNLRLLYIIIGIVLMAGSFVWQRSPKQSAAGTASATCRSGIGEVS